MRTDRGPASGMLAGNRRTAVAVACLGLVAAGCAAYVARPHFEARGSVLVATNPVFTVAEASVVAPRALQAATSGRLPKGTSVAVEPGPGSTVRIVVVAPDGPTARGLANTVLDRTLPAALRAQVAEGLRAGAVAAGTNTAVTDADVEAAMSRHGLRVQAVSRASGVTPSGAEAVQAVAVAQIVGLPAAPLQPAAAAGLVATAMHGGSTLDDLLAERSASVEVEATDGVPALTVTVVARSSTVAGDVAREVLAAAGTPLGAVVQRNGLPADALVVQPYVAPVPLAVRLGPPWWLAGLLGLTVLAVAAAAVRDRRERSRAQRDQVAVRRSGRRAAAQPAEQLPVTMPPLPVGMPAGAMPAAMPAGAMPAAMPAGAMPAAMPAGAMPAGMPAAVEQEASGWEWTPVRLAEWNGPAPEAGGYADAAEPGSADDGWFADSTADRPAEVGEPSDGYAVVMSGAYPSGGHVAAEPAADAVAEDAAAEVGQYTAEDAAEDGAEDAAEDTAGDADGADARPDTGAALPSVVDLRTRLFGGIASTPDTGSSRPVPIQDGARHQSEAAPDGWPGPDVDRRLPAGAGPRHDGSVPPPAGLFTTARRAADPSPVTHVVAPAAPNAADPTSVAPALSVLVAPPVVERGPVVRRPGALPGLGAAAREDAAASEAAPLEDEATASRPSDPVPAGSAATADATTPTTPTTEWTPTTPTTPATASAGAPTGAGTTGTSTAQPASFSSIGSPTVLGGAASRPDRAQDRAPLPRATTPSGGTRTVVPFVPPVVTAPARFPAPGHATPDGHQAHQGGHLAPADAGHGQAPGPDGPALPTAPDESTGPDGSTTDATGDASLANPLGSASPAPVSAPHDWTPPGATGPAGHQVPAWGTAAPWDAAGAGAPAVNPLPVPAQPVRGEVRDDEDAGHGPAGDPAWSDILGAGGGPSGRRPAGRTKFRGRR